MDDWDFILGAVKDSVLFRGLRGSSGDGNRILVVLRLSGEEGAEYGCGGCGGGGGGGGGMKCPS